MSEALFNRRRSDQKTNDFLSGQSQMAAAIRAFDWSWNSLGPTKDWPRWLKTAVQTMLTSRYPMFLACGPDLLLLHNDGYVPLLGQRQAEALGSPMKTLWTENWDKIGPQMKQALEGSTVWNEEFSLVSDRNGFPEECFFTYSLSPIRNDEGGVGGVLGVCREDTLQALARRRFHTLRDLAEMLTVENNTVDAVCSAAAYVLRDNGYDLPFSFIYLLDKDKQTASLKGVTGLDEGHPACPSRVALTPREGEMSPWPFAEITEVKKATVVDHLAQRLGPLPCGPWPNWPHTAVVLPLLTNKGDVTGFLVAATSPRLVYNDDYLGFLQLITQTIAHGIANARANEEEKQLINKEAQLHQASKLESVGRLAGGVAHDFNNLITGIIGISEEIKGRFADDPATCQDIDQIIQASKRAFDVTKQLLAFARRQVVQPIVLDVNVTVMEVNKLLQQLLGEDIKIQLELSKVSRIKIDRGHFDQILLNLAVNARDAMPDGGTLIIRTTNVALSGDQTTGDGHFDVTPGSYVLMEVIDNGIGMNPQALSHLFEPFYTTKERAKGAGLGLSMIYGIVKQSGGDIQVKTEPGKGTAFSIYLPATSELRDKKDLTGPTAPSVMGRETILVVEDEDIVRRVVVKKLTQNGCTVLEAPDGKSACDLVLKYPGRIDLVLTDVVMPEMNGRQVADRIRETHPDVAVLFMSGYPEEVIAHRGVLEPGIAFIEKSEVSGSRMIEKVRDVLKKHRSSL